MTRVSYSSSCICCFAVKWPCIFYKKEENLFFMPSSNTCKNIVHIDNAHVPWNKWKSNCSCEYISIFDSSAFNDGMFMKFNNPQENQTNMKEEAIFHEICRKMDRLWRIWFFSPHLLDFPVAGCHFYYQYCMRLLVLQWWPHISPWEIADKNLITSDKASSRQSSHLKKLITDSSKNIH